MAPQRAVSHRSYVHMLILVQTSGCMILYNKINKKFGRTHFVSFQSDELIKVHIYNVKVHKQERVLR